MGKDLNEPRGGSSLQAIKKHVQANMTKVKEYKNGVFLLTLKRAVSSGALVQTKGCYKISPEAKKAELKKSAPKKAAKKPAAMKSTTKKKAAAKKTWAKKKSAAKKTSTKKAAKKKTTTKKKKTAPKKAAPKKVKKAAAKKSKKSTQRNDFLTNNMLLHFNFSFTYLTMRCTIFAFSTGFYQIRPLMKMFES